MNPLALSPDQHAALYQAARDHAQVLRQRAIAEFLSGGALRWLRRRLRRRATADGTCGERFDHA